MATVIQFRPYRLLDTINSDFIAQDPKVNEEWCLEDLAKSGLLPEDIAAAYAKNIRIPSGALAAYHIPYFDVKGDILLNSNNANVMYRRRYKLPEFSKNQRYVQPSSEDLVKEGLPSFLPYLLPYPKDYDKEIMYCIEGEKKTAAFIKYLQLPAFGIGGCGMWGDPLRPHEIHPWIDQYLELHGVKKVVIVPDSDVHRYDQAAIYGSYVKALINAGYSVELLSPPAKIDDFIVANRLLPLDLIAKWEAIPKIAHDDLVQSPGSLLAKFALAFKTDAKGNRLVLQHTANIMKLMEEHNAFPKIWRNTDNNRVMVGEALAQPDLTEMQIANYFQYNLGFDKVTSRTIYSVIQALSKKNARSPMLDFVRGTKWDMEERLETWFTRLWGIQDSAYTREIALKWMVGACARMDQPGTKIDWMPIIVGPQGTGKTSMPALLYKGSNITIYGDQNDKDLHMMMHSALCVGFDELDSFGKRESSTLKAMITRSEDAFRPPYGASVEVFPRRFTLYGCGNRYEFLQYDPSGYRRYAVLEVTRTLDFAGLEAERDQLWAEAWYRYQRGGINFWEISGASDRAERYVVEDPIETSVLNWLLQQEGKKQSTQIKDGYFYFNMTHLLSGIGMPDQARNPRLTGDINGYLRKFGVEKCHQTRSYVVPGVTGRHYRYKLQN